MMRIRSVVVADADKPLRFAANGDFADSLVSNTDIFVEVQILDGATLHVTGRDSCGQLDSEDFEARHPDKEVESPVKTPVPSKSNVQ